MLNIFSIANFKNFAHLLRVTAVVIKFVSKLKKAVLATKFTAIYQLSSENMIADSTVR